MGSHFNYHHCDTHLDDATAAILYVNHTVAKVLKGQQRIHQLDIGDD